MIECSLLKTAFLQAISNRVQEGGSGGLVTEQGIGVNGGISMDVQFLD
jgi:hypothetical protein